MKDQTVAADGARRAVDYGFAVLYGLLHLTISGLLRMLVHRKAVV